MAQLVSVSDCDSEGPEIKTRRRPFCLLADSTLIALVGRGQPLPDRRTDGRQIFDYARVLTENMLDEAVLAGYDLIVDQAIPSEKLLGKLRARGYHVEFVVMQTPVAQARRREVRRDLEQLGWGRVGLSSTAQKETAAHLGKKLRDLTKSYADKVTRCSNSRAVMSCSDGTRIVPDPFGPDTRIGMRN